MLHCVSFSNGIVGTFSSQLKVKELVFDTYPNIPFIVQVYKRTDPESTKAWIVLYKDTELIAYASDNKEDAIRVQNILNTIGKSYDEAIDYWEQDIDHVNEIANEILVGLNKGINEQTGFQTNDAYNSGNIFY